MLKHYTNTKTKELGRNRSGDKLGVRPAHLLIPIFAKFQFQDDRSINYVGAVGEGRNWASTNTGITGITRITGITSEYRTTYTKRVLPTHKDATVHQVLQYYFRFTARFDLKFEKPNHANIQESHQSELKFV